MLRIVKDPQRYDWIWVCLLFLSFTYDRPVLQVLGFLRADPRPFDFVFAAFLVYAFSSRAALKGRFATGWYMKRPLGLLLGWACVVVMCQSLWIPWEYERFSVFYLFRYFQLYAAVWLVATSSLTDAQRRGVLTVFLVTIVIISSIGALQYYGTIPTFQYTRYHTIREYADTDVAEQNIHITSTLGFHYVYLGAYSVLGIFLAFLLLLSERRKYQYTLLCWAAIIAGLVGLVVSQALSGYGTLAIGFVLVAYLLTQTRSNLWHRYFAAAFLVALLTIAVYWLAPRTVTAGFAKMWKATISATTTSEYDPHNPLQRFGGHASYLGYYLTDSGSQELLFGRGFYAARGIGGERRIGYGLHDTILFMLEQAGPIGFLLGLNLIWTFIAKPWKQMRLKTSDNFSRICGSVMFAWAVALIIAGQAGQIFWIVESLTGWFTVVLCVWSLLIRPSQTAL